MARQAPPLAEHVFLLARLHVMSGARRLTPWRSTFEGGPDEGPLSKGEVEELVQQAMRNLHGDFGAAEPVSVLRWESGEATIRVVWEAGVSVRAALTLLTEWRARRCRVDVLRTAATLAALPTSADFLMPKSRRLKGTETAQEQREPDTMVQ